MWGIKCYTKFFANLLGRTLKQALVPCIKCVAYVLSSLHFQNQVITQPIASSLTSKTLYYMASKSQYGTLHTELLVEGFREQPVICERQKVKRISCKALGSHVRPKASTSFAWLFGKWNSDGTPKIPGNFGFCMSASPFSQAECIFRQ